MANGPALIGLTFFQQVAPIDFDPLGAIQGWTGTNRLALTVGIF